MYRNNYNILIIIFFPYLYLFPHTFQFIEMGNDFELLYFSYKKYIFEFINIGHLPLWSPSESLGYSLIFNPFAQYLYPLSWFLYLIAFLIGDLSKHLFLLYTIAGVSIYNVGQYLWLKELKIDVKYCLFSTLIVCAGLKVNEILRFPNAIHAFCWFPWILYSVTISIQKNTFYKPALIIFLSTLCVLTAGYPYYIIYAFILVFFYFVFISLPNVKILIYDKNKIDRFFKFLLKISIPPVFALILVSPWLLGIQELMDITRDRNLNDINFSRVISSDLIDHIGSWVFPTMSQAETNYYPGSITVILMILYLITYYKIKEKTKFETYFLILFIFFYLFIFQISNSQNSFIFEFIWNKIDFIKNFRAFGRINILLIPFFAVLICFALKNIVERNNLLNSNRIIIIIGLVICLIQIYIVELANLKSLYWETWQAKRLKEAVLEFGVFGIIFDLYNNYIYSIFLILSVAVLILIKKYMYRRFLLKIILILTISELFLLSNIQWAIPHKYYDENGYNKLSLEPLEELKNAFKTGRVSTIVKGNTYFRNNRKFNINYFDQFGVEKHTEYYDLYFTRYGNYKKNVSADTKNKINLFWALGDNNKKVFFTNSLDHDSIEAFINDVRQNEDNFNNNIKISIEEYDGDKLIIEYNAKQKGFISFIDNWSPRWEVFINDQKENIELLLGSYKSVKVNQGLNKIMFKYNAW